MNKSDKDKVSDEEFVEKFSKEELDFLKAWEALCADEDFQRDFEAVKRSIDWSNEE